MNILYYNKVEVEVLVSDCWQLLKLVSFSLETLKGDEASFLKYSLIDGS